MNLADAIAVLNADMLGVKQADYHQAYLDVAFADPQNPLLLESAFSPESMINLLGSVLEKRTGATKSLIIAAMDSPNAAKALAAKNFIDLKWVLEKDLMQFDKPITNVNVALVVFVAGSESPKFGDALAYLLTEGGDVPEDIRKEVTDTFEQAVADHDGLKANVDGTYEVTQ